MSYSPRPSQNRILQFSGGKMGVLAVPGSGKTQTLSGLAAKLIINGHVGEDQEVLIVTLVNSAVDNFSSRIEEFLSDAHLFPGMGYRVRTLHGLCHDIIRERPDLVGFGEHFQIIDERENNILLETASQNWLRENPDFIKYYANSMNTSPENHKNESNWLYLVSQAGGNFIRMAKDLQISPDAIQKNLGNLSEPSLLLNMGSGIYASYQKMLRYREAVDFDDLIRLALQALETDEKYLERLQLRWPYILEDEAQDSSRLQENILRLLSKNNGNWVRVGDPNQAIYETFTTANPKFLRDFVQENGVTRVDLPESGRSSKSIQELANRLILWAKTQGDPRLKNALEEPFILQTPLNDPQPNPPDQPEEIHLFLKKFKPEQEIDLVSRSIKQWIEDNPQKTLAVLSPSNAHGLKLVEVLEANSIPCVNMLQINTATRSTIRVLAKILAYLVDPDNKRKFLDILNITLPILVKDSPEGKAQVYSVKERIKNCSQLEDFLYPVPGKDWLEEEDPLPENESTIRLLASFRRMITRWQEAASLPVDQLVLAISREIFFHPPKIALAYKLALLLEMTSKNHPDWQLPRLVIELEDIASNSKRFYGYQDDDTGFDPNNYPGKVIVTTVHKAKGLEWDRVYLLSVNNYDYPSASPQDQFVAEKYFVRQSLNLPAETLAQLSGLLMDPSGEFKEEGAATREARCYYARERIRLFYVGITRARQQLVITSNTGKTGRSEPALPFQELVTYWSGIMNANTEEFSIQPE